MVPDVFALNKELVFGKTSEAVECEEMHHLQKCSQTMAALSSDISFVKGCVAPALISIRHDPSSSL